MGALAPGPGGSATPTPSPRERGPATAAAAAAAVRAFLDAASERATACAALEVAFMPFLHGADGGEVGYRAACEAAGGVLRGSAGAAPRAVEALTAAGLSDLAATVGAVSGDEAHRIRIAVALHALRKAGADAERGGGSGAADQHDHGGGGGCGCGPGGAPTPPADAGLEAARDAADRAAAIAEATVELEETASRINDGLGELREALMEGGGVAGGLAGGGSRN